MTACNNYNNRRQTYGYANSQMNGLRTDCKLSNDMMSYPCSSEKPIGMSYVPMQVWQNIYDPEKGLSIGTIFAELDQPFCGIRGCRK